MTSHLEAQTSAIRKQVKEVWFWIDACKICESTGFRNAVQCLSKTQEGSWCQHPTMVIGRWLHRKVDLVGPGHAVLADSSAGQCQFRCKTESTWRQYEHCRSIQGLVSAGGLLCRKFHLDCCAASCGP